MNLFSTYRIINAEDIIKANIRPNHITEDAHGLWNALRPITYIANPDLQKATCLHRNIIQKLDPKPHTLDLLKYFGYELNGQGDYVYHATSEDREIAKRENAAKEFQRFHSDLIKIKDGSLDGFEVFILNSSTRSKSNYNKRNDSYHKEEARQRSPPPSPPRARSRLLSPPRMPNLFEVKEGNEKTLETIRSFKQSIISKHSQQVAHSFIRRKLLLLLFVQNNPDSVEFDYQLIDDEIDQRVELLKKSDRNQKEATNEVYFECLIRANFKHETALEMLRSNRPNLKPPPEPEIPREPTTTTLGTSLQCLREQWLLLNADAEENGAVQMLIEAGDEWKNTMHVVTAIIELRKHYKTVEDAGRIFNKMHRLIYSELSSIIDGSQSSLKIEILANALCEVSFECLEYLNMADIRDILRSCSDTEIPENFEDNTKRALSMECLLCSDSFPRSHMERMFLCDHTCCLTCIKQYYRGAIMGIRDADSLKRLTCFTDEFELSDDIKLNFFQYLGTKVNQWFTDERLILDKYHENLFLATRGSQVKKCGNPRCVGFFDNNNNTRPGRAQCPHCQFQQCQHCCRKWLDEHKTITCEQYADWLKDNDPDDPEVQLTKYLNTAGMMCPNEQCKAIFEYQPGGCEHFKCRQCQTEFCRICSALFYNPEHNTICPRANCGMRNTLHAHCYLNCFREIRDAEVHDIIKLLTEHNIDAAEELRQKPQATSLICPVEGCKRAAAATCENRFCETCYKQFLCLFVWRNEIQPWELYTDNNLRQKLTGAAVAVPANATRPALIELAGQHLTQFLGKPKKISRQQ